MTATLLCTTISAPDCGEMARKAGLALSMGSDLVELRVDHLSVPRADDIFRSLADVFSQAVVTVRPRGEGGRFSGGEDSRMGLLGELASHGPAFVDVELAAAERDPDAVSSLGAKRIVSWHDFRGTPSLRKLSEKARAAVSHGDVAKVVTMAKESKDVDRVLALYGGVNGGKLVAFCMGALGTRSRTEAVRLGSPLAYCSLDSEPVAPGQIPLIEMRRLLGSSRH